MKTSLLRAGVCLCATLIAAASTSRAADYLGAAAVLQKLSEAANPDAKPKEDSSEAAKLKSDLDAFKKQSTALKPEDAARTWLALLDRQMKLPTTEMRNRYGQAAAKDAFNPQEIWNALPPPPSWDALRQATKRARRQRATPRPANTPCVCSRTHSSPTVPGNSRTSPDWKWCSPK